MPDKAEHCDGAVTNTNGFKKLSHEPTLRYNMYGTEP